MRVRRRRRIATLLVVVAAIVSWSAPPAAATATDYRLRYVTGPDGVTRLARWNPCQTISFQANVSLAGDTRAARRSAASDVRTAVARLSRRTGIAFRYTGRTTYLPNGSRYHAWWEDSPAELVVAWVDQRDPAHRSNLLGRDTEGDWADGTGGFAFKSWNHGRGWQLAAGRGFVVINAADTWDLRPGFGRGLTRGELLLHELGHVMGLAHVSARSQTMYPVLLPRAAAGYRSGDRAGLLAVGRAAGCISVPHDVWSDI
jgi:hypothetical protein